MLEAKMDTQWFFCASHRLHQMPDFMQFGPGFNATPSTSLSASPRDLLAIYAVHFMIESFILLSYYFTGHHRKYTVDPTQRYAWASGCTGQPTPSIHGLIVWTCSTECFGRLILSLCHLKFYFLCVCVWLIDWVCVCGCVCVCMHACLWVPVSDYWMGYLGWYTDYNVWDCCNTNMVQWPTTSESWKIHCLCENYKCTHLKKAKLCCLARWQWATTE